MGNSSGHQFANSTNCSDLTAEELVLLNLVFCSSAAVCFVISCVITLLLLISKSYNTVLQRLLLYLMIPTTLSEVTITASVDRQFEYPEQDDVCTSIAYLHICANILRTVFTGIMVYLFFLVRYQTKGNIVPQFLQSKCRKVVIEVAYAVLLLIITFVYASVPIFTGNYRQAGGWCWIKALDENCKLLLEGLLGQLFFGSIIFVSNGIIGILITLVLAMIYCRLPIPSQESKLLLKKTFFIMVCFFGYVIIQACSLSNRMITADNGQYQHFALWLAITIIYPSSLVIFPVGFIFIFYPVHKAWSCVRALKRRCCQCSYKKRRLVRFQHSTNTTQNMPTFQDSTRVSFPSSTFFNVPYTNEFTHITTENAPLVHNEFSALNNTPTAAPDTEYGSVSHQKESEMS